jgi:pimeloyl-ACP methyl ester carboxylesterase
MGASFPLFSLNALAPFELRLEPEASESDAEHGDEILYRDSLGETLHVSHEGRLLRVEIPAQKIVIRRAEEEPELFTIETARANTAPADLDREEVVVSAGAVSLAGTITRPKDRPGPYPAVFFISGSGGQDRDGYSQGIDLGTHEILDRLTREGFLVLRVDDRGVGESKGPTEEIDFDDLVADARSSVAFLRERQDVDRTRIVLVGHSEGGETAPILAAEGGIAAVVLMAAPARTVIVLMHEQLRRARELEGESAEQLAEFDAAFTEFFELMQSDEPIDAELWPADLSVWIPARAWVKSHARIDPLANIVKVPCPILILQGERDIQVSPERDAKRLLEALDGSGHGDHELILFPELDHLFKKTSGETSSGLDYLRARPVDPRFLDALVAWLEPRMRPSGR